MATGTIRYWAAAQDAAGLAEERYDAPNLDIALSAARASHGPAFGRVLDRCSFIVDEAPVGHRRPEQVMLTDGGTIEVLPPFAGG
jgi:molybdopterin converting factor small subunit